MVTLIKYGALGGGEKYNVNQMWIDGLSTDSKPTTTIDGMGIPNGSVYTEVDTGKTYMFDKENATWYEVSIGGGGGTSGGIILVGTTTTQLTDGATTNPITVDGQSYTAQPNDAVIYGNKEFLFDGTNWHEFGDLSGLSSKDIGAMTDYEKASAAAAISTSDTLNQAVGKLEKWISDKGITFVDLNGYNSSSNTIDGNVPATFTDPDGTFIIAQFTASTGSYVPANVRIRLHYRTTTSYTTDLYYNGSKIQDNVIKPMEYCLLLRKKFPAVDGYYLIAKSSSIDDIINITSRLSTVENNILSEQAKTTGMTEGGSNYITVGGIRVYVSATAPTGARTGDLWIGG